MPSQVNGTFFDWWSEASAQRRRRIPGNFEPFSGRTSASILSIDTLDSTHLRVNFAAPVLNNAALNNAANYATTPTLTIFRANSGVVTPTATSVILTTSEMRDTGGLLTDQLTILLVEAA